jgi:hypothetical protein
MQCVDSDVDVQVGSSTKGKKDLGEAQKAIRELLGKISEIKTKAGNKPAACLLIHLHSPIRENGNRYLRRYQATGLCKKESHIDYQHLEQIADVRCAFLCLELTCSK